MSERRWIIYKITSENTDKVYIGSDNKSIDKVLRYHINRAERYKRLKCYYLASYEILKMGGIGIEEIEIYNCKKKNDLLKREEEYIMDNLDICVNIFSPLDNNEIIRPNKRAIENQIRKRKKELEDFISLNVSKLVDDGYSFEEAKYLARENDIKMMNYIDDNIEEIYSKWMSK